ncbi:ATP-dependent DNA helicase PcrA [Alicyclobacillus ferrooxydans]|uniref:ATP-dependent DNA helicase n=1 Tax=Alicyclobacillus ferrooxydans TaxID=471514 RepID=A0A0N8PQ00_9BACL|nr:ATP-dependent DNA helicase PcrA [Alicyclobacillus ferrooxydans]
MPTAEQILSGLNPPQRQAVEQVDGPVLVIAGAGSGKTNVLTRRIAYLIVERRVPPWAILAITFTNKAAKEMQERIEAWTGSIAADVWAMTFHAMCVRILRRDGEHMGISRNFTILDAADQLAIVKRIMDSLNIDTKRYDPKAVLHSISSAKNELQTAVEYTDKAADPFRKIVAQVYQEYERRLKANQSLDFDDLIFKTVQLLSNNPDVLRFYQTRFQYIHVDEYQDTNHAQYKIVSLLSGKRQNICVVGDSDQSIYAWRGADIRNILDFEKEYPNARVIRLEQNYRSTKTILEIANGVIENNRQRRAKKLWTENHEGDKAVLYQAPDERAEARYIVEKIQSLHTDGLPYGEMSILYRTNAQSRVIEEAFLQAGIPYRVFGGLKFYDRKEIKDVLSYLRLVINPDDDVSMRRVINVPKRGIGDTSIDKLQTMADRYGTSLYGALGRADEAGVHGKSLKSLAEFVRVLDTLIQQRPFLNVTELTESLLGKIGYREMLKAEKSLEAEARLENLDEFLSVTREFDARYQDGAEEDALASFLTEVALIADVDLNAGRPEETIKTESEDQVVMMTLHSAKGLEFPTVFLPGMEEGLFPHMRSLESDTGMEEERRLCYVGVTRAKQKLFLTTCTMRTIFGQTRPARQSRFLAEMPKDHLTLESGMGSRGLFSYGTASESSPSRGWTPRPDSAGRRPDASAGSEGAFAIDPDASFHSGDKVEHRKWGQGTVVSVHAGDDLELTIAFPAPIGIKRLVARFAPIRKVD